jgi:hypothetical protein
VDKDGLPSEEIELRVFGNRQHCGRFMFTPRRARGRPCRRAWWPSRWPGRPGARWPLGRPSRARGKEQAQRAWCSPGDRRDEQLTRQPARAALRRRHDPRPGRGPGPGVRSACAPTAGLAQARPGRPAPKLASLCQFGGACSLAAASGCGQVAAARRPVASRRLPASVVHSWQRPRCRSNRARSLESSASITYGPKRLSISSARNGPSRYGMTGR